MPSHGESITAGQADARLTRRARPRGLLVGFVCSLARGADVFVSGHTPVEHAAAINLRRGGTCRSVLALEAGAAVSDRTRGAGDSINVLKTSATVIELEVRTCRDGLFGPLTRVRFARTDSGWQAA